MLGTLSSHVTNEFISLVNASKMPWYRSMVQMFLHSRPKCFECMVMRAILRPISQMVKFTLRG